MRGYIQRSARTADRSRSAIAISDREAVSGWRGMPEDYTRILAAMYASLAHGSESRMNGVVREGSGEAPMTLGSLWRRRERFGCECFIVVAC